MNFQELKNEVLAVAEKKAPNCSQTKRLRMSNTIEDLCEVAKDNIGWVRDNINFQELIQKYDNPEIFNVGKENTGLFNAGDLNAGDRNSGDRNSGDRNSGDRNSGDLNSGDLNSGNRNAGDRNSGYLNAGDLNSGDRNAGDRNSGDLNAGYRNSGDRNSGDRNSGNRNAGDRNSGDRNSGNRNAGDRNSGDLNAGYRNSGVFCTRKREDTVPIFNKDSSMTWDEWYSHPVYSVTSNLMITEWVSWDNLTEDEKKDKPKAFISGGYVKVYTYHEAWSNLWKTLSDNEKNSFKTLPNYDPDIFEEITGIRFE